MNSRNKFFLLAPFIIIAIVFLTIGMAHLVHPSWVGEQYSKSGYLRKAVGLITDAPHATAELFYSTIENIVILAIGFAWGKRIWRKEHKKFDDEHGVRH
jgi:hypothetical protein